MVARNSISILSVIGTMALLWLGGCAAAGENAARTRWDDAYSKRDEPTQASETPSPDLSESPTLGALLALAESRNPGLRARFDRWTAALEQVPQAKSLPDPKVSYAYFIESVETRVGPQRQKFGASQTIPLFGKLGLRGEVAAQAANAVGANFEAARRHLRYRITQLWDDYYYLGRAIAITDENVHLLTNLESVALTQYTAGKAPHSAIIRAQVELGRLEDRLRTLRDQRVPILAALNAELNRPESTPIAWPDSIETSPLRLSQTELRNALLSENPQLAALSFLKEREAAAVKLAGRSPIPDLTIGAEYIDTGDARFPGILDSGNDAAIVKATINIPLWFGRYRAEKAQAEARLSATRNEHTQLQNRLLADLERVHFELRDAERRVDLYAYTLIPKARQSLEVTENAFTTGKADFLDLIDAQRTLLEFELSYERALTDRATRRAQLEQIVGTDLKAE
jgi:outer membrane protein TolC